MKKAIFKFNNGNGALLCSKCRTILKVGYEFTEEERKAMKGEVKLKAQYCDKCKEKKNIKNKWISVKDRLPEYKGFNKEHIVIVSGIEDEKRYVYWANVYAYGKDEEIFSVPGWSEMNVTHWMPLPKSPE